MSINKKPHDCGAKCCENDKSIITGNGVGLGAKSSDSTELY